MIRGPLPRRNPTNGNPLGRTNVLGVIEPKWPSRAKKIFNYALSILHEVRVAPKEEPNAIAITPEVKDGEKSWRPGNRCGARRTNLGNCRWSTTLALGSCKDFHPNVVEIQMECCSTAKEPTCNFF